MAATLLAAVLVSISPAQADTTFVVDTVADDGALSACTLAAGDCSLRGAVAAANVTAEKDTIAFTIPALQCPGGVCPITLTDGPLTLTEAVTIDATTQPQNSSPQANVCATSTQPSHMRIELVTTGAEPSAFIIDHAVGSSTIRGFAFGIDSNLGLRRAITTSAGNGHHVACNHFGLDAAGSSQLGTQRFNQHVLIDGVADSVIVGTDGDGIDDLGERNVFGPATRAVYVNANDNSRISGNYIGFTADGTTAVSAGSVLVRQSSSNTLIGSDRDGVSDEIESNYFSGSISVQMDAAGYTTEDNRVIGNVIGMSPTGNPAPVSMGIRISRFEEVDTGYEISDNFIVSASTDAISIEGIGSGLVIDGNVIGQTPGGTPSGNQIGIHLADFVSPQVSNNLIASSMTTGVQLEDTASFAAGSTGNCIHDNTAGVSNSTGSSVTFEDNWWNAIDGPSGAGPGSGDTVSADVDFTPWLANEPASCNTAPSVDDATFSINAGATVGTLVGTMAATDDGTDLAYAITAEDPAGVFAIGSATGAITTVGTPDYPATTSYELTVKVTDTGSLSDTATVTVDITNSAPIAPDAAFTVAEDAAVGTKVGTVIATDGDNDTLSYVIDTGDPSGVFAIDADGSITTAGPLDYETMPSYSLGVDVDDGFESDTADITVTVTDIYETPTTPTFDDVPVGHTFFADIEWLAADGITKGCNPPGNDLFCPDASVTRGQMAAFLHRALGDTLTPGPVPSFSDVAGSIFEADIEWLGAVGVTKGCNPPVNDQFCPDSIVTRQQMAAFLVRALNYSAGAGSDQFSDDNGSVFEADIERLAEAGVTKGCNPPANDMFCPSSPVSRGQMAAFLHRALS